MRVLNAVSYILALVGLIAIAGHIWRSEPNSEPFYEEVTIPVTIVFTELDPKLDPESRYSINERLSVEYAQVGGWGKPGHTLTPAYLPAMRKNHVHEINYVLHAGVKDSQIELQDADELHLEVRETKASDRENNAQQGGDTKR